MTYRQPYHDPEPEERMRVDGLWWKLPVPIATLALVAVFVYGLALEFRSCTSGAPKRCVAGAEIRRTDDSRFECEGGHIWTEALPPSLGEPHILMHCVCGADLDGGRP